MVLSGGEGDSAEWREGQVLCGGRDRCCVEGGCYVEGGIGAVWREGAVWKER